MSDETQQKIKDLLKDHNDANREVLARPPVPPMPPEPEQ